jgi:penicillin-binding protein 1A
MFKTFFSVLAASLIVLIMVFVSGLWVFYRFGQDLPDYRQLATYEPPVVSRLYAADGRMFAEYSVEKRVFVPINAMPKRVVKTFLAAEDKNFYTHPGIDGMGIVRAALNNLVNAGKKAPMGASTITQQVAKNFFLTNERSIVRKIKEAILAFRIENALSKDRILEIYLNQIYLGQGSYGVAAAALNYFNKALDELTIDEAAYLAALPKAPNNYHPDRHPEAAKRRRNYVIDRMEELDIITKEEAKQARERPIALQPRHEASVVQADFFAEEVRRELVGRFGQDALYKGGLVIKTTLNPTYQAAADMALRQGILDYDRRHGWRGPLKRLDPAEAKSDWLAAVKNVEPPKGLGAWQMAVVTEVSPGEAHFLTQKGEKGQLALEDLKWARACIAEQKLGPEVKKVSDVLAEGDVIALEKSKAGAFELKQIPDVGGAIVVLDPNTGRTLAMSGGYSYAMSEFNRATQAIRQPGSAFKTFVYLTAFENKKTPSSIVLDTPLVMDLGPDLPIWRPNNITKKFYGPVTLRTALEQSYNVSTIKTAQAVGIKRVAEVAQRLGVIDNMPAQLAMALGAGETTPKKMALAYATFVNGGKRTNPTLIDRIQDRHGQTIFRYDNTACGTCQNQAWESTDMPVLADEREQIVDPIHAYQILSILEGVTKRGTAKRLNALNTPLAGKTGSTNDYRDAWFVGLTPKLSVAIYIGFDNHKSLGPKEVGGRAAVGIFEDFAKKTIVTETPVPFRVPAGAKLMRVNLKTGRPTSAKDPQAILECFAPGAEPTFDEIHDPAEGASSFKGGASAVESGEIY